MITNHLGARLFEMPGDHNLKFVEGELGRYSLFRTENVYHDHLSLLDTFDWRLYNNSLGLYLFRGRLQLIQLKNNRTVDEVDDLEPVQFAADLPESGLKSRITPIVNLRALLVRAKVDRKLHSLRVLNSNLKTVAMLEYEEILSRHIGVVNPLAIHLRILEVQGYSKQFNRLLKSIIERGFREITEKDRYLNILQSGGIVPGDYSSRIELMLDPKMRSIDALKEILGNLLLKMRQNEDGIKADLDTEFLHDHRVAVRRTRSALTQMKDVLPRERTARFIREFDNMGEATNTLRDLDVYLLKEDDYSKNVPPSLSGELKPMFDYLKSKRENAHAQVVRFLDSNWYHRLLTDWEAFLVDPFSGDVLPQTSLTPVRILAKERVTKQYTRILKDGRKLLKGWDDEMLHVLRIDCKKLRYLLEFFSSIFRSVQVAQILGNLRQLQDILGDYHDFIIQQASLMSISAELELEKQQEQKTHLAIGSLINSIETKKINTLAKFESAFLTFSSPKNRRLFREALKSFNVEEGRS